MARIIRVGTTEPVLRSSRIRHCVVEAVTDQDNITVRLGSNDKVAAADGTSVEFAATRGSSTTTRGFIFSG
jgi:hypothetical protein